MEFADGYEGVTVAGLAVVAADTGRVFLAKRAFDETDDPDVQETWEFPGGHLDPGEDPETAAFREFNEEIGFAPPAGEVIDGWRSPDEHYQGFVFRVPEEFDVSEWAPTAEVAGVGWFSHEDVQAMAADGTLRPEIVATMDWNLVFPETEETVMEDSDLLDEPDLTMADLAMAGIPVHGVLAPEDIESGDQRGFSAGAITSRPYRLPFMWQKAQTAGHDSAITVGSVDRLMRKDGLIHWDGMLMPSGDAGDFSELLSFFGRYGVSVDGDKGNPDIEKIESTGVLWYDAARASGLTAVAIPAFAEAYVAFGPHPDMPAQGDEVLTASMVASGDLITFAPVQMGRGPGWVTNPKETKRIHDYWTKPGQPGFAKIGWGTPGDFTRAKKLIGAKIAANSPEDMRFLNQIIAQWHFDALGYWPGDWDKPGNDTTAEGRTKRKKRVASSIEEAIDANEGLVVAEEEGTQWEAVLVSSATMTRTYPPRAYFDRHGDTGALVIEEPDANGLRRTYGYAGEWGVCHIAYDGSCVEVPSEGGDFAEFHLGRTKVSGGAYINTGLITYKVDHRDAATILSESAEQQHFDNIAHAWAAVRLGTDERGIWFSGVVLPGISDDDLTVIEAAGQVSGEWKYGALRALQAVNVPGFPVMRSSAVLSEDGDVLSLVASAFETGECVASAAERMDALRKIDAEIRFQNLKDRWV